jgi:exosortase K
MCAFYSVNYLKGFKKAYIILCLLGCCYLLTVFVNVTRIVAALSIAKLMPESRHFAWLHQAEGIFIYLSFMIALYMTLNPLFTKLNLKHAKTA